MAAGAPFHDPNPPSRRRSLRYSVEAPLDVTVLRSGIPDTVPGRSLNLGTGGVAAVLAAELLPGDPVGVEIRLPQTASPMRTRAMVRHHDKLCYGMEFVGLSAQQQAAIRDWSEQTKIEQSTTEQTKTEQGKTEQVKTAQEAGVRPTSVPQPASGQTSVPAASGEATPSTNAGGPSGGGKPPGSPTIDRQRVRGWLLLALSAVVLLAVLWWRWNRGWEDLESGLRKDAAVAQPQAHVPADVMAKLVRHRVDPDYPDAARPTQLHGVIVLDVIVGRDGSVLDVHPLNGPDVLAQAAAAALRWWRFEPYRVDGQPVVVETTVAVEFNP